jgi:hypothetical protein
MSRVWNTAKRSRCPSRQSWWQYWNQHQWSKGTKVRWADILGCFAASFRPWRNTISGHPLSKPHTCRASLLMSHREYLNELRMRRPSRTDLVTITWPQHTAASWRQIPNAMATPCRSMPPSLNSWPTVLILHYPRTTWRGKQAGHSTVVWEMQI